MDGVAMSKSAHKAMSKIIREHPGAGVRMIQVSVNGGYPYWRIDTRNRDGSAGSWRMDYTTTLESAAERWFQEVVDRRLADTA